MNDQEYKAFVCSYPYGGSQWGFTIYARSYAEAEARLKQMPFAKMDGELIATIPYGPGAGLLVRAATWLRNLLAREGRSS